MTEPLTNDPAPPTMMFANATPDSALHPPPAAHQQHTQQTTAAEKTHATATTTAKARAAIETVTAIATATVTPTTAAATVSKSSHALRNSNHQRRGSEKKRARSSSAMSALRHRHVLAAAAETRIAGANRRLAEAIVSARGRPDGRRIAMALRGGIAVVVLRALIDMCLAEVVLVVARVANGEIEVVSETGIAKSAGSRIDMYLESAVAGTGTEAVLM